MIFEDATKKYWKRARLIFGLVLVFGTFLILNILFEFVNTPDLFRLRPLERDYGKKLISSHIISSEVEKEDVQKGLLKSSRKLQNKIPLINLQNDVKFFGENFLKTAFVLQDDEKSVEDLKKHTADLDIIFPDWFSLSSDQCSELHTHINSQFEQYLQENRKNIFPRFSNTDSDGVWKGDEFIRLIKNESRGDCLISTLKKEIKKNNVDGINLDIENLKPEDREFLNDWLAKLTRSFHENNLAVTIDLPVNDNAFDYEFIGALVDRIVLMTYDEHYAGGNPGPIASKEWFENAVEETLKKIPKQKIIIAMGNYAYDWIIGSSVPAKPLSFVDAMILANKVGADVETNKTAVNSYFLYTDDHGHDHAVWLLDAISLWNSYHFISTKNVSGISFWRLGIEDVGIWKFFGKENIDADVLSQIDPLDTTIYEGSGQFYKVTDLPTPGEREITRDEGFIDYAQYTKIPTPYVVEKFFETHKPQVLFTFDDGPDPMYTPQILHILKKYAISALFFMVGDQIERFPDIAKQVADDGHFIGNHTFNHPNIADVSDSRLRLELNSTQRFIESTIGQSTILFRAPYDTDADPTLPSQLKPLYTINTLGYIAVGGNVDSSDYKKPGVDIIVNDVLKQLDGTTLNIIVMHDAGGDRTQSVAALDKLIPAIREQGYDIISLDTLLGIPKSSIMPSISFSEQILVWGNSIVSFLTRWGWGFIAGLFFLTTLISIFRVVYLGYFVFRGKGHTQKLDLRFSPHVSILIPAFNEEKVIERTIRRVLKSHYDTMEILVIDDGSTDKTPDIVRKIAKEFFQVQLISKENGGKWTALNLGFEKAKYEYIITIDADTLITPNTISYLVAPFVDENIDAVCGNIEVGNVRNILTAFQSVEYITSQNYDRRAFDELNCISVVPGATGAWRKSKILSIGGYSGDTLTEDADLTLTLLSRGGKIVYSSQAKSITEAPETIKTLYKQRFRWTYGTFQCLWKHRKLFGKGNVGLVALPNMFLFQVVFPILSPLGDAVFFLALIRGDALPIIFGYFTFLLMDLAGTLIALTLEKKSLTISWVVLIQRFFYRQFMYVITYKSIIATLRGNRYSWNKLERTANMKEEITK